MLFVATCVMFESGNLSVDICSLLYSYLGFILSILSYIGEGSMNTIVVVVIGSMVGTKQHER